MRVVLLWDRGSQLPPLISDQLLSAGHEAVWIGPKSPEKAALRLEHINFHPLMHPDHLSQVVSEQLADPRVDSLVCCLGEAFRGITWLLDYEVATTYVNPIHMATLLARDMVAVGPRMVMVSAETNEAARRSVTYGAMIHAVKYATRDLAEKLKDRQGAVTMLLPGAFTDGRARLVWTADRYSSPLKRLVTATCWLAADASAGSRLNGMIYKNAMG